MLPQTQTPRIPSIPAGRRPERELFPNSFRPVPTHKSHSGYVAEIARTEGLTGKKCSDRVYVQSRGARTKQGSPPEAATDGGRIAGYAGRTSRGGDRKARPRPLRGVDVAERPVRGSRADVADSSGLFLSHFPILSLRHPSRFSPGPTLCDSSGNDPPPGKRA